MLKPVASGSPVNSEGRKKKENIYINFTQTENISFRFLASQKPPDTLVLCCIRGLHGLILLSDENITFPSSTPKADLLPICSILLNSCMRAGGKTLDSDTAASWLPKAAQLGEHGILFTCTRALRSADGTGFWISN